MLELGIGLLQKKKMNKLIDVIKANGHYGCEYRTGSKHTVTLNTHTLLVTSAILVSKSVFFFIQTHKRSIYFIFDLFCCSLEILFHPNNRSSIRENIVLWNWTYMQYRHVIHQNCLVLSIVFVIRTKQPLLTHNARCRNLRSYSNRVCCWDTCCANGCIREGYKICWKRKFVFSSGHTKFTTSTDRFNISGRVHVMLLNILFKTFFLVTSVTFRT